MSPINHEDTASPETSHRDHGRNLFASREVVPPRCVAGRYPRFAAHRDRFTDPANVGQGRPCLSHAACGTAAPDPAPESLRRIHSHAVSETNTMAGMGDEEIAARLGLGDAEALGSLFERHAQAVLRFCWRRMSADESAASGAEDLMSIVFLKAWDLRNRIVLVEGSARPWLFAVATRLLANERRSRRRYSAALERYRGSAFAIEPEASDEVVARVDAEVGARRAIAALADLTTRERDVAELCLVEECSVADAARVLGVSEGTVKSRLARARARLRTNARSGEVSDLVDGSGHQRGVGAPAAPRATGS